MSRSGLMFRFLVILMACVLGSGPLVGDVSQAQSLRVDPRRLGPTPLDRSFLQANYTEIVFATRDGREVLVENRRRILAMPNLGAGSRATGGFVLQSARWASGRFSGRNDGFFVNEREGQVAKRILDSRGRIAGAFLITARETETLYDLNRDGFVELAVLNSADGFVRLSFAGEAGRAAFERLLMGQNPFCVSAPRASTEAERARGDAAGCPPGAWDPDGTSAGPGTGRGSTPQTPIDIVCAGYDPIRGRFSGGVRGLDPDNPLPVTESVIDFARNGFDGQQDRLAAAGRFVILSPVIGLVAIYEFGYHEIRGGGQLGLIMEVRHHQTEAQEAVGEGEDGGADGAADGAETPPDTTGGDTSRPGPDGGDDLGGALTAICGSRSEPSQSDSFRTAFAEALTACPNPVESTAAAGDATATCMSGAISRPRGPRGFLAVTEAMLDEATSGCSDDGRCVNDSTGRLRQLRDLSTRYIGARDVCDPAICHPTPN